MHGTNEELKKSDNETTSNGNQMLSISFSKIQEVEMNGTKSDER